MLAEIHSVPLRIADLKRKLAAREGKAEYKENIPAIKAEIARLEAITTLPGSLASDPDQG